MAGKLVPLVMLPRYTSFAGQSGDFFHTVPIDVTDYQAAILTAWRGPVRAGVDFGVLLEESIDQNEWTDCDGEDIGGDPGENTEAVYVGYLSKRWLRLRVTLGAASAPMVTCWAVGHLEAREP